MKRISSSFPNASPSRLKQGEEAAQQEFIPAFFLKRKTYNQSGRKRNNLSSCVSYLRRKPGSLKYSCESGSKRLPAATMPARTDGAWARTHRGPPACGPPPHCPRATRSRPSGTRPGGSGPDQIGIIPGPSRDTASGACRGYGASHPRTGLNLRNVVFTPWTRQRVSGSST